MKKKDFKLASFLAYKNIVKSKSTFLVIVVVMAMSFISIIFFASIINGLGYQFEEGMINGLTGNLMIEPTPDNLYLKNVDSTVEKIRRIPGIVGVAPRIESSAVAKYKNTELGVPIFFVKPDEELKVSDYADSMIIGDFLSKKDSNDLIIGANLVNSYAEKDDTQKRLDVNVGDTITLSFSNGYTKDFKIKGIFKTGSKFSDDKVLINYDVYKTIFGQTNIANKILIKLPTRGQENYYKKKLLDLGISSEINPWQTKMGAVKQFVGSLDITNKITDFIGLLTAFATIYIIIFINVTSKRKQIGILKAIGIKKGIILGSYVLQSFIYGFFGILVGNILMQVLLALLTVHPLSMPIGNVVPITSINSLFLTSLMLIFASIVAGFFPSKKAADDNILDAIFGG